MSNRPRITPHYRTLGALALAAALTLTACAAPDEDRSTADPAPPSPTATQDPSPTGTARPSRTPRPTPEEPVPGLEVTVAGSDVGPNAQEIALAVGEPLLIAFDADRSGELHVHSKPDQYVKFTRGTSTQELRIQTPGIVEVEEHDTGVVVAIIEVR